MEKMTKKEMFAHIAQALANEAEVVDFCAKEIKALEARAEKAKERAAKKAQEADELTEAIYAVLGDEPMTLADIVDALGREDVSAAKVNPRARKLAEAGRVERVEVAKAEGRGKLVAYKLVG